MKYMNSIFVTLLCCMLLALLGEGQAQSCEFSEADTVTVGSSEFVFYGMWGADDADRKQLKNWGVNLAYIHLSTENSGTKDIWKKKLQSFWDQCIQVIVIPWGKENLSVIPWGYDSEINKWLFTNKVQELLTFLSDWKEDHPNHVIAISPLDEPYANACIYSDKTVNKCIKTTPNIDARHLKKLRMQIHEKVDLPIFYPMKSLNHWEDREMDGVKKYIDPDAFDWVGIYHYPFFPQQTDDEWNELFSLLKDEKELIDRLKLSNINVLFFGQSFGDFSNNIPNLRRRMPSPQEMIELRKRVKEEAGEWLKGFVWYVWHHGNYHPTLSESPKHHVALEIPHSTLVEPVISPDGTKRAAIVQNKKGTHFQIMDVKSTNIWFPTFAQHSSPNDVKAGIFSHDSRQFAAAYHYEHNGKYTWVGVWDVESREFLRESKFPGWIRYLTFPIAENKSDFKAFESLAYFDKPDLTDYGLTLLPELPAFPIFKEEFGSPKQQKAVLEKSRFWPSVIPWVLDGALEWPGFWSKNPPYKGEPNLVDQSAMRLATSGVKVKEFFLDIEPAQFPLQESDGQLARRQMQDILQALRAPNLHIRLGYYSIVPIRGYWSTIYQIAKDKCDLKNVSSLTHKDGERLGGCPQNVLREIKTTLAKEEFKAEKDKYARWNRIYGSLATPNDIAGYHETRLVDALYPSAYTKYFELCDNRGDLASGPFYPLDCQKVATPLPSFEKEGELSAWTVSRLAWKEHLQELVREAHLHKLPVYVFLTPQFIQESNCIDLQKEINDVLKRNVAPDTEDELSPQKVHLTSNVTVKEKKFLWAAVDDERKTPRLQSTLLPLSKFQGSWIKVGEKGHELDQYIIDFAQKGLFRKSCRDAGRDGRLSIPGDYWRFQLETVYQLADGMVLWDAIHADEVQHLGAKGSWKELTSCIGQKDCENHWWYQTHRFLEEIGVATSRSN
jgi:hypothetical protein